MSNAEGRIAGKVAIVTGGASGIGEATARRFGAEGARVVVADRDAGRAGEVAAAIADRGGQAIAQTCDVRDIAQLRALVDATVAAYGGIDAVVHCAGRPSPVPLTELDEDEWDVTFDVHVKSVLFLTKAAARHMTARGGGAVVTIGSAAALAIMAGQPAYCAAKGAVITLTKALAVELAGDLVRVNCICPGIVRTPMLMTYFGERFPDDAERRQILDDLERPTTLGRMAEPSELASAALFLVSADASYVNGAVVSVDGGLVAVK
jgi:3-oxoacyl-[acyl-carrier protein] reductase